MDLTTIFSVDNAMRHLMLRIEIDMTLKDIFKRQNVNQQNLLKIIENVPCVIRKNCGYTLGSTHALAYAVSAQLELSGMGHQHSVRLKKKHLRVLLRSCVTRGPIL